MITLEVADLVVIAGRTLGLDSGQVLDLLDVTAAEFALAQARQTREPVDLATRAAVLLDVLVRGEPLRRGNREVALAAMLQFLALNGQQMDPDPPGPVAALVAGLASGTLDVSTVAEQLAPRLRPASRPARRTVVRPAAYDKEAAMPGRPVSLAMRIRKATMRNQPKGLFARFTDRARLVVCLAQEEARLLRHDYVGAEHLLLALLYEGQGVGAKALDGLGISRERVLAQVEEITGHGQGARAASLPFNPQAKKALELSLREALALGHHYIGTEHILLGLLRESESVPAQVLTRLGVSYDSARELALGLLSGVYGQESRARLAADLAEVEEQLSEVRRQKEAAFDAGDLDSAARLRDRDRQLLADKLRLKSMLTDGEGVRAAIREYHRLNQELDRLRGLLCKHGIDPDSGTAQTA